MGITKDLTFTIELTTSKYFVETITPEMCTFLYSHKCSVNQHNVPLVSITLCIMADAKDHCWNISPSIMQCDCTCHSLAAVPIPHRLLAALTWFRSTVLVWLGAAETEMRMRTSVIQSRWNLNGCAADCTRSHWKTQSECWAFSITWVLRVLYKTFRWGFCRQQPTTRQGVFKKFKRIQLSNENKNDNITVYSLWLYFLNGKAWLRLVMECCSTPASKSRDGISL